MLVCEQQAMSGKWRVGKSEHKVGILGKNIPS